ncbi:MAG: ABC transporter substrate-binding protein, partial [Lachnospiraceae bacterium]|nr:ABC transporter substrate-binding protein [Lachnospiraceae bacterium]
KNLSIMVYTMSKRVNPSINAVSTLVVVIITIALIIINVAPMFMEKRAKKEEVGKKKVLVPCIAGAVVLASILLVFGMKREISTAPYAGQTLYIYMPGEYIGENVIPWFEEATGATVVMENFDSNEQMYIKVANGESYDILIPSDYMIQRLMEEKMLQTIDVTRLDSFDELDEAVKGPAYDPNDEYSVSYFWGTVGIVYDKTKVDIADLEDQGYGIFLNEKYKGDIYLYDSERDSFMMALKDLGYSMNTESEEELQAAYEWLVQCVETMEPEIVTDEIIDNMAQGRKALGLCYSGDATYIMSENENMGFYLPEEGTNIWYDSMVIPANAENVELAYEFINFISAYDNALDNSAYVGYTSPNAEVAAALYGEGGDYEGIDAYVPRTDHPNDEVFEYNAETRKLIGNLWSKVKIAASNAN